MSNWVNVKLSANSDVINAITNDKGDVDFELTMPMPSALKDYWTGSTVSPEEQEKEIKEKGLKYGNGNHEIPMTEKDKLRFLELYGSSDWYNWRVDNWGTKWNAQTVFSDTDEVVFETPWEEPHSWIHNLSLKFPKHKIWIEWEEEQGYGEIYSITNGEKDIVHEWEFAEWDDEIQVGDFSVAQCIKSGGRGYEAGMHKYVEGHFYVDYEEEECYSSIEEVKEALIKSPYSSVE